MAGSAASRMNEVDFVLPEMEMGSTARGMLVAGGNGWAESQTRESAIGGPFYKLYNRLSNALYS